MENCIYHPEGIVLLTRSLLLLRYSYENSPIQKELDAIEVGNVAAFLTSPLASAVTGHTMFVDNGLNTMGLATDSKTLLERA